MKRIAFLLLIVAVIIIAESAWNAAVADGDTPVPVKLSVSLDESGKPSDIAASLRVLLLLTALSVAPAFLIMTTSFTRIIVVLSFLRRALSTQQMPSNQILIGLALFLTLFVMAPVWQEINTTAVQPYLHEKITQKEAFNRGLKPLRAFMFKQTRQKDIALFVKLAKLDQPRTPADIPTRVLIPAFIISELKTAFQMGFVLFLPFLVIDMVVASVLMSMGMMMLPPIMISMPFKILLFVLVDGWYLVVRSLAVGFC